MPAVTDTDRTVVVYASDPAVRDTVRTAVGRRPDPRLGRIDYVECATAAEVIKVVDAGGVDLCVLDGEADPTGGMGLSRQLHYEVRDVPATVVLTGRRDDGWLASWSLADATVPHPVDPVTLAATVVTLLRERGTAGQPGEPRRQPAGRPADR